jgi:superfamily II DNA helicase RecQ
MTPATTHRGSATTTAATSTPAALTGVPTTPWTAVDNPRRSVHIQSSPLQRFDIAEVPSSPPILSSPTRPPRPSKPDLQQRERAVRKALGLADMAPVAYKSPKQGEALERIMNGSDSALAVVLPTGGGKSLLFTAPACLEDPGKTAAWRTSPTTPPTASSP